MLCLVAALAVPRTPDTHAALAEPEASDTHELERGLFDRTACKDRIEADMSIWDAMTACSKAKKCAFCAVQVETTEVHLGDGEYGDLGEGLMMKHRSVRNKQPLQGKGVMHLGDELGRAKPLIRKAIEGVKDLNSDVTTLHRTWMYRCTSHPFDWHGYRKRTPPRCAGAELGKSSKDTKYRSGPGWLVPMEKKKLTKDYYKLYRQVVMDEPCLCVQDKFDTTFKYLPKKPGFFGKLSARKTRARGSRLSLAVHACQKELDPVIGAQTSKYSEEELKKCLNKDDKDDESEKMTDAEWAERALQQFQQELDQGVIDQQ